MKSAAKLLLPAVYVKRERDLKRLVHFSYIRPHLFVYWKLPRWIERLIFPWNDPAKQAEYDADPDDLIRSGYGW